MDSELYALAEQLGHFLSATGQTIATAESCTGGWVAKAITEVPGSSEWFDRGFVTYSNAAKMAMLGVKPETLLEYGAVSQETAQEMVAGVLQNSDADCAVAVTGIAGPDGGTPAKPVGTVFIAWQTPDQVCQVVQKQFLGGRREIRAQAVKYALGCMLGLSQKNTGG